MRRSGNRVLACLALLLFLLFWKGGVAAPVEWSVSTEDRNDGTVRVLFTARIEAPWHIYDLGPMSS